MINGLNIAGFTTGVVTGSTNWAGSSAVWGEAYYTKATNVATQNAKVNSFLIALDDINFEDGMFTAPYNGNYNTTWSDKTILYANFDVTTVVGPDGTITEGPGLNFGNLNATYEQCSKVLIKKRNKSAEASDWVTIHEQPITSQEDFNFSFIDYTNPGNSIIEYCYVPVLKGIERAALSSEVKSEFEGWFLCEPDIAYNIYLNGSNDYTYNQEGATVVTLDRKYPYTIHNGKSRYFTGSLKGIFYSRYEAPAIVDLVVGRDSEGKAIIEHRQMYEYDPKDYYFDGGQEKRIAVPTADKLFDDVYDQDGSHLFRRKVDDFLVDGKPKILKDFEGCIWLVDIINGIQISGEKLPNQPTHTIPWVEIGDVNNGSDLYKYGFSNTDYDGL